MLPFNDLRRVFIARKERRKVVNGREAKERTRREPAGCIIYETGGTAVFASIP